MQDNFKRLPRIWRKISLNGEIKVIFSHIMNPEN